MSNQGREDNAEAETIYLTKLLRSTTQSADEKGRCAESMPGAMEPDHNDGDDDQDDMRADIKDYLYVRSKWLANSSLHLTVQEAKSGKCYRGNVSSEELSEIANELDIAYPLFIEECRCALAAHIAKPKFTVQLELRSESENQPLDNSEQYTFKLNKFENFEVCYLEVPLKEMHNQCSLLDTAVDMLLTAGRDHALTQTIKSGTTDGGNLNELRALVEAKEESERRLMKRFVLLLQQKKNRIAELEQQLAAATGRSRSPTPVSPRNSGEGDNEDKQEDDDADEAFTLPTQPLPAEST